MIGEIAEKIAVLRKVKGYTLKELSDRTGLSISFLSQIENGASSLAITSLKKIADALEVPIVHFFATEENPRFHVPLDEQKPLNMEASPNEYIRLSGSFKERAMEALMVTLQPHGNMGQKFNHPGEEFVYVMEGLLLVEIDGKQFIVKAGESVHYPSTIPHFWSNPLQTPTKVLSVLTPVIF